MVKEITIFYSWQSETHGKNNNKDTIKECLAKAVDGIRDMCMKNSIGLHLDEAPVPGPGSPDIRRGVFNSIAKCDIFIGDLSITNKNKKKGKCKCRYVPNANVLIEFGYALACVGEERIIIVQNTTGNKGEGLDYLPFDINKNLILQYQLGKKNAEKGKQDLQQKISDSLKKIIEQQFLIPSPKRTYAIRVEEKEKNSIATVSSNSTRSVILPVSSSPSVPSSVAKKKNKSNTNISSVFWGALLSPFVSAYNNSKNNSDRGRYLDATVGDTNKSDCTEPD
jgi:hypothetical protein